MGKSGTSDGRGSGVRLRHQSFPALPEAAFSIRHRERDSAALMPVLRTRPPFLEAWLAGHRSRLVSAALSRLSPSDIVNIIQGLPEPPPTSGGEQAGEASQPDTSLPFHRLPEVQAFVASLREAGQPVPSRIRTLRTAWQTLHQKRPADWTAADIFECFANYAATRLDSVARLAQVANLFWLTRTADPVAAAQRARLIDFVEGALVLAELRTARVIP